MNITNDSWSKTPVAEYQHFVIASFLAIEYRTTLVRCCNSGYSAVVLPNGKIAADLKPFTTDAMTVSVPIYERKPTVFSVFGDYFALSAIFIIIAVLFFSALKVHVNIEYLKQQALSGMKRCILPEDKVYGNTEEKTEPEPLPSEKTGASRIKADAETKKTAGRRTGKTAGMQPEKKEKPLSEKKAGTAVKKTSADSEKNNTHTKKTSAAKKKRTSTEKKTSPGEEKAVSTAKRTTSRRTAKKAGES